MNKTYIALIVFVLLIVAGVGTLFYREMSANNTQVAGESIVRMDDIDEIGGIRESELVEDVDEVGDIDTSELPMIEVTGGLYYFKPNVINVKSGEEVSITFKNIEGFHDLVIDELNVKTKQLKVGESETVVFTPDKPGTYEFYCSVGNHRVMGMKGTLIVE